MIPLLLHFGNRPLRGIICIFFCSCFGQLRLTGNRTGNDITVAECTASSSRPSCTSYDLVCLRARRREEEGGGGRRREEEGGGGRRRRRKEEEKLAMHRIAVHSFHGSSVLTHWYFGDSVSEVNK